MLANREPRFLGSFCQLAAGSRVDRGIGSVVRTSSLLVQRSPLSLGIDDAFHYLAVAVAAVMWGVLVMVVASTLISVSYGGESRESMFLILWYARSHLWIPIAAWALLAPRSRGLLQWGWIPALFYLAAYAWLGWLQIGAPQFGMGLG